MECLIQFEFHEFFHGKFRPWALPHVWLLGLAFKRGRRFPRQWTDPRLGLEPRGQLAREKSGPEKNNVPLGAAHVFFFCFYV